MLVFSRAQTVALCFMPNQAGSPVMPPLKGGCANGMGLMIGTTFHLLLIPFDDPSFILNWK